MKRSNILLLIVLALFSIRSEAQPVCVADVLQKKLLGQDPEFKKKFDENQAKVRNSVSRAASSGIQTEQINTANFVIPVVVHVIHTGGAVGTTYNPTDAQITSTIDYLNQVYNGTYPGIQGVGDMQIQFQLATRDPNCNATTGINRVDASSLPLYVSDGVKANTSGESELTIKNLIRWDPTKYYNIWVVNKIDAMDGTSGTFIAGFAYFPGAPAQYDGTIMLATQMQPNRKTLPHEIGHAFGLYHTFQSYESSCVLNGETDCTTEGDQVCDTEPVTQSFACRTGTNACTNNPYSINTENNFMGYSSCSNLFTAGQKAKLQANTALDNRNYGGWALTPVYPLVTYNAPVSASCTPTTSATGLGGNYAGVLGMILNGVSVQTGNARSDAGYKNNTASCQNLFYLVEGQSYTATLKLYGLNAEQAKVWIDFDNNGVFNDATELLGAISESVHPNGSRAVGVNYSIPFTVPAAATKETVLRMRVLEDASTIYGAPAISSACGNSTYGQAEDYAVFIRSLSLLPVELTSFNVTPRDRSAQLRWQTAGEQNSARFDVERSADGSDFRKIGEVAAKGMASVYQYSDNGLAEGAYYYRLKQVDKNGMATYSRSVRINIGSVSAPFRILNNPAHAYVDITMPVLRNTATARLMDMSGRILLQRTLPSGINNYRLDGLEKLSPGVYVIDINTGSGREMLKFVKQ